MRTSRSALRVKRVPPILVLVVAWGVFVAADPPDLSGAWAMIQVLPEIAILPIAGEVPRSSTVAQFVEIEQNGATLTMHDRYCFTIVDDGTSLVTTVIP